MKKNIAPDYPIMLASWLQEQFGDQAQIIHDAPASPFGMSDCAETFTVKLPSRHLDRLCLINQKTGTAGEPFATKRGTASLQVRLVQPLDVLSCRHGIATRQFTVHAQVKPW